MKKIAFLSLFVCASFAQILYVSSESGNDTNPGTDSAPFKSIQKAINSASNGDEIYIAAFDVDSIGSSNACIYTGSGENVIVLTNQISLSLIGGYIYTHIFGNNWFGGVVPSKIDGEQSRRCLYINNVEGVTSEINRITFENGKAEYGGNIYHEARYKDLDIVLSYSKIGKVNASLTAATMIEHFNATKLLFSGVAGAISNDLKVGDLIVATKLAQHDLDITAFGHPFGYVPEGAVFVEADKELIALSKEVAKDMGKTIKEGVIATGDQFVANEERKNWIGSEFGAVRNAKDW